MTVKGDLSLNQLAVEPQARWLVGGVAPSFHYRWRRTLMVQPRSAEGRSNPLHRAGKLAATAAVTALASLLLASPAAHADQNTGYVIVGPVTDAWGTNSGVTVGASALVNNTSTDSGPIFLELWAVPVEDGPPTINQNLNAYDLGGVELAPIPAGGSVQNVLQTGITYAPVPKGCYYVMLALENGLTLVDIFPFSYIANPNTSDAPSPSGYMKYAFGEGVTCGGPTTCTESNLAACLNSGRFQVTTNYYNAIDGKHQANVMNFNSTRAETDSTIFYYFTSSSNFEMGINVLDACALTNSYWIFIGGLTNQGWETTVLDTHTGTYKAYRNVLNTLTATIADTTGLPCN